MKKTPKRNKKESKESENSKKQKKPLKEKRKKSLTLVSLDYGSKRPLTEEDFKEIVGYTIGGGGPEDFSPIEIPPEFKESLKELDAEWEKLHPVSLDTALAAEKILDGNKKEKEEFKTTKKSKEQKKK